MIGSFDNGDETVPGRSAAQGPVGGSRRSGDPIHVQYTCNISHVDLAGAPKVLEAYGDFLKTGAVPRKLPPAVRVGRRRLPLRARVDRAHRCREARARGGLARPRRRPSSRASWTSWTSGPRRWWWSTTPARSRCGCRSRTARSATRRSPATRRAASRRTGRSRARWSSSPRRAGRPARRAARTASRWRPPRPAAGPPPAGPGPGAAGRTARAARARPRRRRASRSSGARGCAGASSRVVLRLPGRGALALKATGEGPQPHPRARHAAQVDPRGGAAQAEAQAQAQGAGPVAARDRLHAGRRREADEGASRSSAARAPAGPAAGAAARSTDSVLTPVPDRSIHCRFRSAASAATSRTGVRERLRPWSCVRPVSGADVLDPRALELQLEQGGQAVERADVGHRRLGQHELLEPREPAQRRRDRGRPSAPG